MARPWILDYDSANCAIGATVGILGERPTFLVLREAFNGVRRFDDMQRRTGMPRQVLSNRLSRLVSDGLLRKTPYRDEGQRPRSWLQGGSMESRQHFMDLVMDAYQKGRE